MLTKQQDVALAGIIETWRRSGGTSCSGSICALGVQLRVILCKESESEMSLEQQGRDRLISSPLSSPVQFIKTY